MRRILAYATLVFVLSACGIGELMSDDGTQPVVLTPSDLVGVWTGSQGDSVEFTADSLFYGTDLMYMFQGDLGRDLDLTQGTAPASGSWQIGGLPLMGSGSRSYVSLSVDVVANQPTAIAIDKFEGSRTDTGLRLRYYIGDPDSDDVVEYRRCTANCPSVAPHRPAPGTPAAPTAEELAGTWRDQHGAGLTLLPGGLFDADDLRFAYFAAPVLLPGGAAAPRSPLPATGTWFTAPTDTEPDGPHVTLVLRIQTVAGRDSFGNRRLTMYRDGKGLLLATFTSNPDVIERHVYRKAAA